MPPPGQVNGLLILSQMARASEASARHLLAQADPEVMDQGLVALLSE